VRKRAYAADLDDERDNPDPYARVAVLARCACDTAHDAPALAAVTPKYPDVPALVAKRTVADLAEWPYPRPQPVPVTHALHDRLPVEVFRGRTLGGRLCPAGMLTPPRRGPPPPHARAASHAEADGASPYSYH